MATHSSILAWEISWTEEPGRLVHGIAKESDTTEQLNNSHSKIWIVLQLWCWLATKVHKTYPHAHSPEKYISQKQISLPCCQHQ